MARCGISSKVGIGAPYDGLGKTVYLDGKKVGTIEAYVDPPAVAYEGKLPNVSQPKCKGRRSLPEQEVDDNGVIWTNVSISYNEKHPKAYEDGRHDGWTTIPFP